MPRIREGGMSIMLRPIIFIALIALTILVVINNIQAREHREWLNSAGVIDGRGLSKSGTVRDTVPLYSAVALAYSALNSSLS